MVRFSAWHVTLLLWAVLCAGVSVALDGDLDCNVASVVLMGDGRCDEEYNTLACGFDGGDCCECTCWDNEFSCGIKGYNCVDPDATCDVPGSIFRYLMESTGSHSPTGSPTPSTIAEPMPEPVVDDNDAAMASTSDDSSTTTGVIVGVSAAVVVVGVGMYLYRKRRSGGGRYDATSEYTAAGYSSNLT